jgi:fumarate reductase subunit D
LRLAVAALVGLAIGLGSGDVSLHGGQRVAALVGSVLGALLLLAELALVVEAVLQRWPHPALRIGLRVVGSWLIACALLMVALALKKGA